MNSGANTTTRHNVFWIAISAFLIAGCVSNSEGLRVDPDAAEQSGAKPVNLETKPADSVTASDVINRSKANVQRSGEIYLMRGLANVFSRGIDDMAKTLRSRGYDASNFSYTEWPGIANDIIRRNGSKKVSNPIVIIGHSLGGNESSKFANKLAQGGVKVELIVAFDPVETGQVGAGISRVVNYYLPKSADNRILPTAAFTGKLDNIDVTVNPDITHTNVDKNPSFQAATLKSIANITTKRRPVAVSDRSNDSR
jgi:hypothetical protein